MILINGLIACWIIFMLVYIAYEILKKVDKDYNQFYDFTCKVIGVLAFLILGIVVIFKEIHYAVAVGLLLIFSINFVVFWIKEKLNGISLKKVARIVDYKKYDDLKASIVKEIKCDYCHTKSYNTRVQCMACERRKIENIKVVIFAKEEMLFLCKYINSRRSLFIEMENLLKKIKENGMKIVVIGTNMKRSQIRLIEKSKINNYIDFTIFDKKRTTIERDRKFLKNVIQWIPVNKEEMVYIGNFNDAKMFVFKELGVYSVYYNVMELDTRNAFGFIKSNYEMIWSTCSRTEKLEKVLFGNGVLK